MSAGELTDRVSTVLREENAASGASAGNVALGWRECDDGRPGSGWEYDLATVRAITGRSSAFGARFERGTWRR